MKKIIIALVLVAGLGTLVYQSTENAKLSKIEHQQARVLMTAEDGTKVVVPPPSWSSDDQSSYRPSDSTPQKPGCRNTLACNYDSTATTDGGTCEYAFWTTAKSSNLTELFPANFYSDIDYGVTTSKMLNAAAFESKNDISPEEISIKVTPKTSCSTSGCVTLSVIRFSVPAETVFLDIKNVNFKPVIETKGWVSQKTATMMTGMKACDQIKQSPTAARKIQPVNLKVKQ